VYLYSEFIMGINSISSNFSRAPSIAFFLAPLHALISLFVPVQNTAANKSLHGKQSAKNRSFRPRAIGKATCRLGSAENPTHLLTAKDAGPRRLKIVREFEPGVDRTNAGRMVICGRMADVCAELDRMAQQEARVSRH
jgi:hypothetical protein